VPDYKTTTRVILFAAYTVCSGGGLVILKQYLSRARHELIAGHWLSPSVGITVFGGFLYVTGFLIWLAILSNEPLSRAYPIAVGLTLAFTTIVGWFVLKEPAGLARGIGIVLIAAGIWLVSSTA